MDATTASSIGPVAITEDEAAVYDRQIRLWGLEAQQRMRNATILVVRLTGVATEVIKNIVLAGIGKLVILDNQDVSPQDLGAGFFFRDDDVGKKRVEAAKARIESLNPLVAVEAISTLDMLQPQNLDTFLSSFDLVCVTDWHRDGLIEINDSCRRLGKLFYAGGCYGLLGYIFCDLLHHEYIAPDRSNAKDTGKTVRHAIAYTPLKAALNHSWKGLTKKQTRDLHPAVVFTILALWEFQSRHAGQLPDALEASVELESIANQLMQSAQVNPQTLTAVPTDQIQAVATTASHEFSPVCAVLGGFLAQDLLKALAAREPPIANFFTFDGTTGAGTVCRMNMPTQAK